jgi:hypothetical protein
MSSTETAETAKEVEKFPFIMLFASRACSLNKLYEPQSRRKI